VRVGLVQPLHELPELKMDTDDVRPKTLHLPEVGNDLGPLVLPVILQQPAVLIAVVVEPPRDEPDARCRQDEAAMVVCDLDILHRGVTSARPNLDEPDQSRGDCVLSLHENVSPEHGAVDRGDL
jgi:hypothetical protein